MGQLIKLWQQFWANPWQARFTVPLLVINIAGSLYGFYWYHQQLAATPPVFWPVVPDSPLATTFLSLLLLAGLLGSRPAILRALAGVACIKYGLWAVYIISQYWYIGGSVEPEQIMLWISHLGMVLQGWTYLRGWSAPRAAMLLTVGWLVLNDLMDYTLNLHPYLFAESQLVVAETAAVVLTLLCALLLLIQHINFKRWNLV